MMTPCRTMGQARSPSTRNVLGPQSPGSSKDHPCHNLPPLHTLEQRTAARPSQPEGSASAGNSHPPGPWRGCRADSQRVLQTHFLLIV